MNQPLKIQTLVKQIHDQLKVLMESYEDEPPPDLPPGASQAQITELERQRGVALPQDYRSFLLLHDGWPRFRWELGLLSIEEMSRGSVFDWHVELLGDLAAYADDLPDNRDASQGWVIEGHDGGTAISYFDVAKFKRTGQMEVVHWDVEEIERFPSFTAYLEAYSAEVAQDILDGR